MLRLLTLLITALSLLALVLLTALAGPGCATSRPFRRTAEETSLDGEGGRLSGRWVGSMLLVDVSIDGGPPRPFLLDSGAPFVGISSHAAAELDLWTVPATDDAQGGSYSIPTAYGLSVAIRELVSLDELRVGPVVLSRIDAMIVPTEAIAAALGVPIDGVLPVDVFREFLLTMDFPGGRVTVARGELSSSRADVLPLVHRGLPWIELDLGGARFPAIVDSGSNEFLTIPGSVAAANRFRSGPVECGKLVTLGGMAPYRKGRIDGALALGPHRLPDPVVAIQPEDFGRIGGERMQHFKVTFDLAHDRIAFERGATEPILCPTVRGFGAGITLSGGVRTIGYVVNDTAAARAGLRVGDRIETIDGLPDAQVDGDMYAALLATSREIRLGVTGADGGARRELTVPVETLVE